MRKVKVKQLRRYFDNIITDYFLNTYQINKKNLWRKTKKYYNKTGKFPLFYEGKTV